MRETRWLRKTNVLRVVVRIVVRIVVKIEIERNIMAEKEK